MTDVKMKLEGLDEAIAASNRMLRARSSRAISNNFRKLATWTHNRVKARTPGKGDLRKAWTMKITTRKLKSGSKFRARIDNEMKRKTVYYTSAYDGKRRRKLKADNTSQKWGEVIYMLDVGTKAHKIAPRRYKNLIFKVNNKTFSFDKSTRRFSKQESTEVVFAKSVNHPGTKAYGIITKTTEEVDKLMNNAADDFQENIITTWEGKGGGQPTVRSIRTRLIR